MYCRELNSTVTWLEQSLMLFVLPTCWAGDEKDCDHVYGGDHVCGSDHVGGGGDHVSCGDHVAVIVLVALIMLMR